MNEASRGRRPLFAYFNNDAKGAAPVNARELAGILGAAPGE